MRIKEAIKELQKIEDFFRERFSEDNTASDYAVRALELAQNIMLSYKYSWVLGFLNGMALVLGLISIIGFILKLKGVL
jgi:hypothetical protein